MEFVSLKEFKVIIPGQRHSKGVYAGRSCSYSLVGVPMTGLLTPGYSDLLALKGLPRTVTQHRPQQKYFYVAGGGGGVTPYCRFAHSYGTYVSKDKFLSYHTFPFALHNKAPHVSGKMNRWPAPLPNTLTRAESAHVNPPHAHVFP